ncbi:MAG: DUF350 domain-containing protein [Gammaproteobacteria bacterium]|nr:DUF350 domain-containing protein [Gammaproteobacteria bacterium]
MLTEYIQISDADLWTMNTLLVDLFVAIILLTGLRFISGLVANVSTKKELAERDNFAFGLSFSGGMIALALMMTGVVSGEANDSLITEGVLVGLYGAVGILLIKLGRVIQDKLVMTSIPIQEEIRKGNLAAAFLDMAGTIATGFVLRSVFIWVENETITGLVIVLVTFLLTQLLLALVTKFRLTIYEKRHPGGCLQVALKAGNVALSLRYFGHVVGIALVMSAASSFVIYNSQYLGLALFTWVVVTIAFSAILSLISSVARFIILAGIDVVEEVDHQENVAIGAIEAAIYVSVATLILAVFS